MALNNYSVTNSMSKSGSWLPKSMFCSMTLLEGEQASTSKSRSRTKSNSRLVLKRHKQKVSLVNITRAHEDSSRSHSTSFFTSGDIFCNPLRAYLKSFYVFLPAFTPNLEFFFVPKYPFIPFLGPLCLYFCKSHFKHLP